MIRPMLALPSMHDEKAVRRNALNDHLERLFDLKEHDGNERDEVETFIRNCFEGMHDARIRHFMPRLFSLRSQREKLIAAFGLRNAASSQLFLETYLDRPIEDVLQARVGAPVRRNEIVEVGNLSALYPGAARWLIVAVTALLHNEGYRWVAFTGTSTLRNGFHRLGLPLIELGPAELTRLPEQDRADWGHYYDNSPTVMAGDIAYGYRSLLSRQDISALLRTGIAPVDGENAA
jgi:hypothetical protein